MASFRIYSEPAALHTTANRFAARIMLNISEISLIEKGCPLTWTPFSTIVILSPAMAFFGDGSFVPFFALTLPALTMTGLKPICRNAISAAKILASKRGFRLHCLPTFDTFILWIILSFQRQNVITSVAEVEDGSLVPASRDKGDRPQPPNHRRNRLHSDA